MTDQQTERQVQEAIEKGIPYFQIRCDVCGHIAEAMTEGSSNFDFCDAPNLETDEWFTVTENGIDYHYQANHRDPYGSNYQVRELTGAYPELTNYSYINRG
jgi:hypothetical protein